MLMKLVTKLAQQIADIIIITIQSVIEHEVDSRVSDYIHDNSEYIESLERANRNLESDIAYYRRNIPKLAYIFNDIENTSDNVAMLKLLRKHLNKEMKMRVRGRGTRKYHGNQAYIDLKHAQRLAVYIDVKK